MNNYCPKCAKEISDGCIVCPFCGFDLINGQIYEKVENEDETVEEKSSSSLAQTYKVIAIIVAVLGFILGTIAGSKLGTTNSSGDYSFNVLIAFFIWILTFLSWLAIFSIGKHFENQQIIIDLLKSINKK